MSIVAKFGGSSLADAGQIKKVIRIIQSNPKCHHIVVSAPGKRFAGDEKITDALYRWYRLSRSKSKTKARACAKVRHFVTERYADIVNGLSLRIDILGEIALINRNLEAGASEDYLVSRGEYLMAKILAEALGYRFIDAADYIRFQDDGKTYKVSPRLSSVLATVRAVIPGFYGSYQGGSICTFSRGGSDITGAIVAAAVSADLYENWTDVSGIRMADPRIVANPKSIRQVTYGELRELAYMGASVFHDEAMFPVQDAGIPIQVRNTNRPKDSGTLITPDNGHIPQRKSVINGLSGRKGFSVITVAKRLMNRELGFGRRILSVLERNKIRFEHMPGGIDTVSLVIDTKQLKGKSRRVTAGIRKACSTNETGKGSSRVRIDVQHGVAMIAVVGLGMIHHVGIAERVLGAVAGAGINTKVINQGSGEMNIIVGVLDKDLNSAIRAVYKAFVK